MEMHAKPSDAESAADSVKASATHKEAAAESDIALDSTTTNLVDVDNYHGLDVKTVIAYLSLLLIAFVQLLNLVGAGAFASDIVAVVGGSTQSVWLSQAIVIVTVLLGPVVSQAVDYWGRKWFLVLLTLCAVVGSIILSRATSMGMAIAGEVICGLSYGAQPLYYAVASEILPHRYRPAAQGGINAALGFGGIVGLLAGSYLIKTYDEGFRIYWYINAGIAAVAAAIAALVYNPPPRPLQLSLTTMEKLRRLDWTGYALMAFGVVLFIMGLSWADNPYSWTDAHVLAPLIIGIMFLVALVVHQTIFKNDGLFHHNLFRKDRNFALALFVIFVDGMVFYVSNSFYAFEVSVLYEKNPVLVGLHYCIAFFAAVVASAGVAIYSSVYKTVRWPIVGSFLLCVIFFSLMATAKASSADAVWGYPVFLGVGIGLSLTCLVTVAQLSAPADLIAITSGLLIAIRSLGASISLGITSSILHSSLNKHLGADIAAAVLPLGLSPKVLPEFIGALASQDTAALQTIPGVTLEIIGAGVGGLQKAYRTGFQGIWIFAAVLAFVAALGASFFVDPKKDMNMHVDSPLQEKE